MLAVWIVHSVVSHKAGTPDRLERANTGKVLRKLFTGRFGSRTKNFSLQVVAESQINLLFHIVRLVYHRHITCQAVDCNA